MYKILVTTIREDFVTTLVIDFDTREEADVAVANINKYRKQYYAYGQVALELY